MTSIHDLQLEPQIFNQDLYTALLTLWFTTPHPICAPSKSDISRWFSVYTSPSEKAAFDAKCRAIALPALQSLGPDSVRLPPFVSPDDDAEHYATFARPFLREFEGTGTGDEEQSVDRALAVMLLLDQLPRNCFRGEEQGVVYAHYDRISRGVAAAMLDRGIDRCARFRDMVGWRIWFYLPLEHSERIWDHEMLEGYGGNMLDRMKGKDDREAVQFLEMWMKAEEGHFGPLKRFGRYPWRNRWLGRESTDEEKEYLVGGGDTFGTS